MACLNFLAGGAAGAVLAAAATLALVSLTSRR
jgi:hypothetical protein